MLQQENNIDILAIIVLSVPLTSIDNFSFIAHILASSHSPAHVCANNIHLGMLRVATGRVGSGNRKIFTSRVRSSNLKITRVGSGQGSATNFPTGQLVKGKNVAGQTGQE